MLWSNDIHQSVSESSFCSVTSYSWQNKSPAERGPKSHPLAPFHQANYWRGLPAIQTQKRKLQEIGMYIKMRWPLRNVSDPFQTIDTEEWRLCGVIAGFGLCNSIPGCRSNQMFELPEGMCRFPDKFGRTTQLVIRIYSTPTYTVPHAKCVLLFMYVPNSLWQVPVKSIMQRQTKCPCWFFGCGTLGWHFMLWFHGLIYGTAVTSSCSVVSTVASDCETKRAMMVKGQ